MGRLCLLGVAGILLFGCTAHTPPGPPTRIVPRAFPTPGEGEGVIVGSLAVQVDSRVSCEWLDVRFRDVTTRGQERRSDASFIRPLASQETFSRKDRKGELFAFSLPTGRYEIFYFSALCRLLQPSSATFDVSADESDPTEFEVAQGETTYVGEILLMPSSLRIVGNSLALTTIYALENQWERDSSVLASTYPLRDWSGTAMSRLVRQLRPVKDDPPQPPPLSRLLEVSLQEMAQRSASTRRPRATQTELEMACQEGSANGCFNLGVVFLKHRGVAQSEFRAVSLFEKACSAEIVEACFNLGTLYLQGRGMAEPNVRRAVGFFKKTCQEGLDPGCLSLATLYEEGLGGVYLAQDIEKAIGLYDQVCARGDAEGCFALGLLYAKGRLVAQDKPRAATLFEKGCAGGYRKACNAAAQLR
jgi:hypothetical protein